MPIEANYFILNQFKMKTVKKICLLFVFLQLVIYGNSNAQESVLSIDRTGDWHGFRMETFDFFGRDARIVYPVIPAAGKPWVWRARFPDWHYRIDSILLSKGFHIAYINTNNMYGCPDAIKLWDLFYNFLVAKKKLSYKLTLEGVSRGGLFIYNWAKNHPDKVNSIYAEAPVCDFKSWPLGQGVGIGSKMDWDKLLEAYHFSSTEEALAFQDNPIEHLGGLAAEKVPVLHMIGLQDSVVPPEENTFILINRYIRMGGPGMVYPNTRGPQKLFGHHFPIDNVSLAVNFIISNTRNYQPLLDSRKYHILRKGILNSSAVFQKSKKGKVAFLGGSITYNPGWRNNIYDYLKNRFPETKFTFISAGIPSMGSTPDAFRLKRDVLEKGKTDLLFLDCAVNDRANGRTSEERIRAVEGIVRHARKSNPAMDIVFLYFVEPSKMEDYRDGEIPTEILDYEQVAGHYGISSVNLAKEVTDRIDAGEFTWKGDFKNLHPSPFGQGVYARSMQRFPETDWENQTGKEIRNFPIPEKIDTYCYDTGELIPVSRIKISKGWQAVSDWHPLDKAGTREGYVYVPMLVADQPGSLLRIDFYGKTVGIAVAAGPDAGIIEYRIDKGKWQKKDLFTKWSSRLHLPWYYILASDLPGRKHNLEVRIMDEHNSLSNGYACRIKHFFVNK